MRRRFGISKVPEDFYGNVIAIGDRYFYGSPPTHGHVVQVKRRSIVIDVTPPTSRVCQTMNCRSPDRGVCLDRVPEGA